jgi:dimethylhistidine N-methyltransferase
MKIDMPAKFSAYPQHHEISGIPAEGIFTDIAIDTLKGLSANPKYLLPKYFYDNAGTEIFSEIMKLPDYYLTRCESEILNDNKDYIAEMLMGDGSSFNLIELGSGDGIKTKILLDTFLRKKADFVFMPVDISQKANDDLAENLRIEFPLLNVTPVTGDFSGLFAEEHNENELRKVILFLGSNIGNLNDRELIHFLKNLSAFTGKGDKLLIGFDLKKSPVMIMKAYDDSQGLTRKFNINHLIRLNRELKADFNIDLFEQHTEYNPVTGKVKSYLVSLADQKVTLREIGETFLFRKWESIFMELSRKFEISQIEDLAAENGFAVEHIFTDAANSFVDSIWVRL